MTIKRGGMAEEPVSGNIYTREVPTYCPKCAISHIQSKLGPRVYKEQELVAGRIPYDHGQWLQCYHCGSMIPRHDIPKEGQLTTDVEKIDSKFSLQGGSEHHEKPKHRRGFNDRLEQDPEIKDPEVRAALKKGAKLISYSES